MSEENTLIEEYLPINAINEVAEKESKAKRYYRPVYTMHKWWARRLGSVFRSILIYSLLEKYDFEDQSIDWRDKQQSLFDSGDLGTEGEQLDFKDFMKNRNANEQWKDLYLKDWDLDKTVLDPFMGGGTTIVEALRLGCNVIGCDLNPVAWFTVKKQIEPVDLDELEAAFEKLKEEVAPEILKYYKTDCPECDHEADAMYYFWVKELDCLNCGETVSLFKDYRLAKTRSKKRKGYWVVCPDCREVFISQDYKSENECPSCSFKFNPNADGNTSRGYYTCPDCGQKDKITESINKNGKPKEVMYAVEYYCEYCDKNDIGDKTNGKSYKRADKKDLKLYQQAVEKYEEIRDELLIPQQKIPEGLKTRELHNHGYQYWKDMFNERQLISIGKLLNAIKLIGGNKIKEFLLLVLSDSTDYNNKFCTYNMHRNHIDHLFMRHAFVAQVDFVENNFWGTKYGRGSFIREYRMIKKGAEYNLNPFEKYRKNNQTKEKEMQNKINGKLVDSFNKLDSEGNSILLNHTSEDLSEIPDKSVDAIITDPPYYDNVMYSELSDFFYVWLREALKDEYDNFQGDLTPKYSEVVKNTVRNKLEDDFIDGLTRVFTESRKKLKDEGVMVFTFHHKDNQAWGAVLKSVLEAGFYISAMYPVQAEMSTSIHIQKQANVEYDVIIVCRKQLEESEEKSWSSLKDKISFQVDEIIDDLEEKDKELALGDIFVIALGKCLEVYSQHYPRVMKDGEQVSVEKAIEDVQQIIDLEISYERMQNLSNDFDWITATYLSYIVGRGDELSYSNLNKELSSRNIDINELIEANLLAKEGSMLKVLAPEERKEYLEAKELKLAIDQADYLYNLVKEQKLKQAQQAVTDVAYKALQRLVDRGLGTKKTYKQAVKLAKQELNV
ncbi:DUF1156 domain-containing protein [Fuchsiella alkaliacetigena]|uniref:DUF1156 domain-containing protein n=1 Tax=Fuchsiella alkaliacetigena TaxID=957042 RepID=UPI00200B2F20|nr:DNA methyltransferase [Fuchsiella alkaliacetigena]MCK8825905.1 DUF1156 domain-containing protein [Fuchsiella alkaliacetigena]